MTTRTYTIAAGGEITAGDPLDFLEDADELGVLAQSALASLLTWRGPDDADDADASIGGWWADAFEDDDDGFGSRIWVHLRRAASSTTAKLIKSAADEALAWMVTDGLAARVETTCEVVAPGALGLFAGVYKADGSGVVLRFADLWSSIDG